MSEMVERVARAISGAPFPSKASLAKARRVIEAMREPTEAMKDALHNALDREEFSPAAANNRPGALDRAVAAMMEAALE